MPSPHEPYSAFLGMWIYGWRWPRKLGGCKTELGGEGGCLCTISPNKAIVVRARSEEQQGPLAGKEEMLQTLSLLFLCLIASAMFQCETLSEIGMQRQYGWSEIQG